MQPSAKTGCLLLLVALASLCLAATPAQWRGRTIYQLLTDRFANSMGSSAPCANLGNYCNGTWQGVQSHLDYIQGMGFDAIWISPVVKNTPGGYHGFWMQDLTKLNEHFGISSDLKALITAAHNRKMYVMVGVVANHVGPVGYDYSTIVPFNDQSFYHECSSCPPGCQIQDFNNQPQVELCRLSGLPDLNQTNPSVSKALNSWVANLVQTFAIDGIRIDTVPEVSKGFWATFQASAGVFSLGEVYNGDTQYVAGYQGPLTSLLSYPLFFTMRNVFAYKQSMYQLQSQLQSYAQYFKDPTVLGTFIDNHDQARFLNQQGDQTLYRAAIAFTLLTQGIPIIYYGTEQGFSGGNDPNNREVLWPTNYPTNSPLYQFIAQVIQFRKTYQLWNLQQVQRYADDNFYAFTRGDYFMAFTNVGQNGNQIVRTITYHPYQNGQQLCNIFYQGDCVTVQNGSFQVFLDHGECKIFVPKSN